jgi:hypothetical protein
MFETVADHSNPARFRVLPEAAAARTAAAVAIAMAALMAPTLIALAVDDRLLNGANVWLKPLHFEMAIAIHFAALVLLLPLVEPKERGKALLRVSMTVAGAAALAEILYIILQAARDRASHFNFSTPIETAIYPLMGLGAVSIVVGSFVVGWKIWRDGVAGTGAGLRYGATIGLMFGSAATLVVAVIMSSGLIAGPGHWVGGVHSDAGGMPFTGWSMTGGDLRVPHFFATHMMQGLPLIGWLADRLWPAKAKSVVLVVTTLWMATIAATFVQALAGLPLIRG